MGTTCEAMHSQVVVACLLLLAATHGGAGVASKSKSTALFVKVDLHTGNYSVLVDGKLWLESPPQPQYLPSNKPLTLLSAKSSVQGTDMLGAYSATVLDWKTAASGGTAVFRTSFQVYNSSLITFKQTYLVGIKNTSALFNTSIPAPTSTCTAFTDRIPPVEPQHAQGAAAAAPELGHPQPLSRTTAQALGGFPSFQLHREEDEEEESADDAASSTSTTSLPQRLNWFTPQGNQLSATAFGRFTHPLGFHALNGQASMPLLLYDSKCLWP